MRLSIKDFIKDIVSFFVFLTILPQKRRKVILLYHCIDNIQRDKDPYKMSVKPTLFQKQMAYLSRHREQYIVTFDDGFAGVYSYAFPVLKKYKFRSILFVTTGFVDGDISFDGYFGAGYSPQPLTWEKIREMKDSGVEIGSHGLRHLNMADLDSEVLVREATESRERIREMLKDAPKVFAYPIGNRLSFNAKTERVLTSVGYERLYTNLMGSDVSDISPTKISRVRIYASDNLFRFKMKVAGAYDWIDRLPIIDQKFIYATSLLIFIIIFVLVGKLIIRMYS